MRFAILFVVFFYLNAPAAIEEILRTKEDFGKAPLTETENVRVNTVRVAIADYDLLARDFPQLKRQENESHEAWRWRVDSWLVNQTGFIAIENAKQTVVNTEISYNADEKKTAYRPKGYGRAFVIPVEGGLIDAKGTGVAPGVVPTLARAKMDGLATLGEVTREYLYEKLVEKLFQHAEVAVDTVGSYAILDYGFNVKHKDGNSSRAGIILRQSHIRSKGHNSSLSEEKGFEIEKLLRRYGITSSGETTKGNAFYWNGNIYDPANGKVPAGATPMDYINIQGTNNEERTEVIDFGAYIAIDSFSREIRSPYDLSKVLLSPDSKDFVQPDQKIRIPLEQWGDFGTHDPKMDKPFIWSHELASAFASGRADRSAFEQHYWNLLGPVFERWK